MHPRSIDRQIVSSILLVIIWVSFALFMVKVVNDINRGQKAIVCMLAVDIEERQSQIARCLAEGGL